MKVELIEDKNTPDQFRVEAIDDDGGIDVAIFSGPNSMDNAVNFAATTYKDFADPTGLLQSYAH